MSQYSIDCKRREYTHVVELHAVVVTRNDSGNWVLRSLSQPSAPQLPITPMVPSGGSNCSGCIQCVMVIIAEVFSPLSSIAEEPMADVSKVVAENEMMRQQLKALETQLEALNALQSGQQTAMEEMVLVCCDHIRIQTHFILSVVRTDGGTARQADAA